MPRDGQGIFNRTNGTFSGPSTWAQQAASASNEINSGRHDTHDQDIAQALTGSLPRDGQAAMTGSLPMGGNRIINLGAPVNFGDGATYGIQPADRTSTRNLVAQASLAGYVFDCRDPDYGAVFDGATDTGAQINLAIQAAKAAGGGVVLLGNGTGIIETPLLMAANVVLVGHGWSTVLRAKNNLNAAVIQSEGFASQTGQNLWLTSEGVLTGMGFFDFQIDGNKANQTSGRGIEIYGKRLSARNILIRDCKNEGWYSECGFKGGQTDYTDLPECDLRYIFVRDCDGDNFVYRGPHDGYIDGLYSVASAGWGARFDRVTDVYSGICYINYMHVYSNTLGNVTNTAPVVCQGATVENGFGPGWVPEAVINVSNLEMYKNCRTTGTYQLDFSSTNAQRSHIASASVRDPGRASVGGIKLGVPSIFLGHVDIFGNTGVSTGTGLFIDGAANSCQITGGRITLFNAVGGIGLQTNGGGTSGAGLQIKNVAIDNCATLWENNGGGANNIIEMTVNASTGQAVFSGNRPLVSERWTVTGTDAAGALTASFFAFVSPNVDLSTTVEQQISVPHPIFAQPRLQNVRFGLYSVTTATNWRIDYLRLIGSNPNTLEFKIKLGVAAGAGQVGSIVGEVRL